MIKTLPIQSVIKFNSILISDSDMIIRQCISQVEHDTSHRWLTEGTQLLEAIDQLHPK